MPLGRKKKLQSGYQVTELNSGDEASFQTLRTRLEEKGEPIGVFIEYLRGRRRASRNALLVGVEEGRILVSPRSDTDRTIAQIGEADNKLFIVEL